MYIRYMIMTMVKMMVMIAITFQKISISQKREY